LTAASRGAALLTEPVNTPARRWERRPERAAAADRRPDSLDNDSAVQWLRVVVAASADIPLFVQFEPLFCE